MICSNCGQQNPDVAKFCMACGNTLPAPNEESSQPISEQIPPAPVPQEQQQDYRQAESQQTVNRQVPAQQGSAAKKKTVIVVVIVVAVLLLCCILTTVFAVIPTVKSVALLTGITTKEDVVALLTGENDSNGSNSTPSSPSDSGPSSLAESAVSMHDIEGDYDTWFVFATADGADPTIACVMTIEAISDTHGTVILTPYEVIERDDYADTTEYGTFTRPCTIDGATLVFNVDFFDTGRNVPFDFELEDDGAGGWIGNSADTDARNAGFLEVYGYMSPYGK